MLPTEGIVVSLTWKVRDQLLTPPENAIKRLDFVSRERDAVVETRTFAKRVLVLVGIAIRLCLENLYVHLFPDNRVTSCMKTDFAQWSARSFLDEPTHYLHQPTSRSRRIDHRLLLPRRYRGWSLGQTEGSLSMCLCPQGIARFFFP